jgi:hypothetical protein
VPALLLCAVALQQIQLARSHALSPWKGGGFGMFSSTDAGRQRRLRVYLSGAGGTREVAIPESLEDAAMRVAALPTPDRLRGFAQRMGVDVGGVMPGLASVRVELWRTRFDPEGLHPDPARIRRLELEWEARAP